METCIQTRSVLDRCGATGVEQQCHPGRKAKPFWCKAFAVNHSCIGTTSLRSKNKGPRVPFLRTRTNLYAVITFRLHRFFALKLLTELDIELTTLIFVARL